MRAINPVGLFKPFNDGHREEFEMTMTRPIYGVNSAVLTNCKNVWFGPLHKVAEAVMQVKYPDFKVDPVKVDTLWRKHKCPGLISDSRVDRRIAATGRSTFYLNGKKFKHFVFQNVFNMKLTVKKLKKSL